MNDTIQVMAPHFNATIQFKKGQVIMASPVLMWLMGRSEVDVKRILNQRGWTWTLQSS